MSLWELSSKLQWTKLVAHVTGAAYSIGLDIAIKIKTSVLDHFTIYLICSPESVEPTLRQAACYSSIGTNTITNNFNIQLCFGCSLYLQSSCLSSIEPATFTTADNSSFTTIISAQVETDELSSNNSSYLWPFIGHYQ